MGRSTGQWAYYLKSAIMAAVLLLGVQTPVKAADTGDSMFLRISFEGEVSFTDQGTTYGYLTGDDVVLDFKFKGVSHNFMVVDNALPQTLELSRLVDEFYPTSLTGSYKEYNWDCKDPEWCLPQVLKGTISLPNDFEKRYLPSDVYVSKIPNKIDGKTMLGFNIIYFPVFKVSGSWGDSTCCFKNYSEEWDYTMFILSEDCRGLMGILAGFDYAQLGKQWVFNIPYDFTLNAECLRQLGYEHVSDKAVFTSKGNITIDVMSYTPYGKKTIKKPAAPLGAMKFLLLH